MAGTGVLKAVENLEKTMIQETLQIYSNQKHAAVALGVDQSTLSRKVKKYKITS